MNTTLVGIVIFVIVLVWIGTNALWAVALFGNKKDDLKDKFTGQDPDIDELHKRVEELKNQK